MSRRDEVAHFGAKILSLSSFRLRRPSLRSVDRRRTSIPDRRSRQLLREAAKATRASYELFCNSARAAEDGTSRQMFELLGQMSLLQTTVIEEKLKKRKRSR